MATTTTTATLPKLSNHLLTDISNLVKDPANKALYIGLAQLVRSISISGDYDDDKLLSAIDDLLQLGEKHLLDDHNDESSKKLQELILSNPGPVRDAATVYVLKSFWDLLDHHPEPTIPSPPEYKYRQADGSHNNPSLPDAGKAGLPYATTVPSKRDIPDPSTRPDPGVIFDLLMGRGETAFEPHPAGFSTFFFAHAVLITHDVFKTNPRDININMTSSYLDLAPLYGDNQKEQNQIRTFVNGEVKRDSFLDARLLGLPPIICVLVVMYARFHNYVASTLAAINEGGKFTLPNPPDAVALKKRDEDLFQVARLATNGLYINITQEDYVRAIFNVNQAPSNWSIELRKPAPGSTIPPIPYIPRGVGNTVSREFNLLYRFHSIQSEKEAAWVTEFFEEIFPGKDIPNMSREEYFDGLRKWAMSIPEEPLDRTFAKLKRNADGSYNDADLMRILREAIDDPAGSFGTNRVPQVMRVLEKEALMQAREWNVASLNEFRAFFNLRALETFEEINPDKDVAATLAKLYPTPNDVELYPGLLAEATRNRLDPGQGLCSPYTVGGSILGDAVSLVRGDRHMTTDYEPGLLTAWGFNEVSSDKKIFGGSTFYNLLITAFPDWVSFNSTYAMQPFYTSAESVTILNKVGIAGQFSFDAPKETRRPVVLSSYDTVATVLKDQLTFQVPQSGYLPSYMPEDPKAQMEQWNLIWTSFVEEGGVQLFSNFADQITLTLLAERSAPVVGKPQRQVDIVKDIANIVALQFASVIAYLPLRFIWVTGGIYSEKDLLAVYTNLLEYSAYNYDPTKTWGLRGKLTAAIPVLSTVVTARVNAVKSAPIPLPGPSGSDIHTLGANFTRRLLYKETPVPVTSDILMGNGYSVLSTVGPVFSEIIDFYLRPENKSHWDAIIDLSSTVRPAASREEDDEKLRRYILEGTRLTSTATTIRNFTPADGKSITLVVDQAGTKVTVNPGDRVITSTDANLDPKAFPKPTEVDLTRPIDLYLTFGSAPRERLGREVGLVCLLRMLRAVANLPNLSRAPGDAGHLKLVTRPNGVKQYMTPDLSDFSSYPTTMTLYYDALHTEVDVAVR